MTEADVSALVARQPENEMFRFSLAQALVADEAFKRLVGTDPQWTFFLIGPLIILAVAVDHAIALATVEEIEDVYMQSWKLGLKATAVYRDNCKVGQPLSDGKAAKSDASAEAMSRLSR